ncbi:MAG: antibiotic biosynthesis monooxygenase, partial [Aeromicrobium sp.]|nr:antibiotic biosynthesis monooxygenase [Aeromicrobium sp.]
SLAANVATRELLDGVALPLRVLASVLVMTPIMTYLALPWITKLFAAWLNAGTTR